MANTSPPPPTKIQSTRNRDIQVHLVNVFPSSTSTPSDSTGCTGGNLAPIVLNASELADQDMCDVAKHFSRESAFVFPAPDGSAVDYELRFFVPEHEMEMCGHATVGTAWVMRQLSSSGNPDRAKNGEIVFSTKAGVVWTKWMDVAMRTKTGDGDDGEMVFVSQPTGSVTEITSEERVAEILSVLRITRDDLAPATAIQNARTSRVKTAIPLKSVEVLNTLRPDFSRVERLCERLGSTGLYPYAVASKHFGKSGEPLEVEARQYPKSSGYPEDAATGIAASALTYALERNGLLQTGEEVVVHQGRAMGFPSRIHVRLEKEGCWVGGMCEWGEEVI